MTADVEITGGGSLYLFLLLTDQAREWAEDYVCRDRQVLGCGLAVEHRCVAALAEGMQADGLVVEVRR